MKEDAEALARALMRHAVEQARTVRLLWTGQREQDSKVHPSLRQQASMWWAGAQTPARLAVLRARVRLAVRALRP